jgi:hypothetical protein
MESYIFGTERNEINVENMRQLLTTSLLSHLSELVEILGEKDFQFMFAAENQKNDKLTPSTAQTPLSIIGTSTILSDSLLRNSSIVELKVGIGQLLILLNGSQAWNGRVLPNENTPDHLLGRGLKHINYGAFSRFFAILVL